MTATLGVVLSKLHIYSQAGCRWTDTDLDHVLQEPHEVLLVVDKDLNVVGWIGSIRTSC